MRMKTRTTTGRTSRRFFEALENRCLLSANSGTALHRDPAFPLPMGPAPLEPPLPGTYVAAGLAAAAYPLETLSTVGAWHSKPAAMAKLFLDFDGAPAQTWDSYSVPATPAYDRDGLPTSFSGAELDAIQSIWSRVAEAYSPFDVDVTTQDPGNRDDYQTLAVVIGGSGDWIGARYGGVAFLASFSNDLPNTVWVFPENLGNGDPKFTASAAAHEAGHAFGLDHQSLYDAAGNLITEYNPGDSQRAPIMGTAYYAARGLWWYGPDAFGPTSLQDDLAMLTDGRNGWGFSADDHGSTLDATSPLTVQAGSVSAAGVIEQMGDRDVFAFDTDAGTITLTGSVAAAGPMLDLRLDLYTAAGDLVAGADTVALGETITATVPAGSYRLVVAGHGGYGDLGQYTISGTIVVSQLILDAPSNLIATVSSPTQVALAWQDNSDGEDGFVVERSQDGGANWSVLNATPVADSNYLDGEDLRGDVTYAYRVAAVAGTVVSDYSNVATVVAGPSGGDGTKFFVVDAGGDDTFKYSAAGVAVGNFTLQAGNTDPRDIAANADGSRLWVVDKDKNVNVYKSDGIAQGLWKADGLGKDPEGITLDGSDLWMGDRDRKIHWFDNAAGNTSGTDKADKSFAPKMSGNLKGLVTDGTSLWVVTEGGTDYVYGFAIVRDGGGSPTGLTQNGQWTLAKVNSKPTGITLDPTGASQSLWVVDESSDSVYEYGDGRNLTAGTGIVTASFKLAATNLAPQGIADPPVGGQAVELDHGSLGGESVPAVGGETLVDSIAGRGWAAVESATLPMDKRGGELSWNGETRRTAVREAVFRDLVRSQTPAMAAAVQKPRAAQAPSVAPEAVDGLFAGFDKNDLLAWD